MGQDANLATATPENTPTPTNTATATDVPGDVSIVDIFYDGAGTSEPDEYVEIRNVDTVAIQVDPFTSEAEILAAADEGSVLLLDINFVFPCQVLPGR